MKRVRNNGTAHVSTRRGCMTSAPGLIFSRCERTRISSHCSSSVKIPTSRAKNAREMGHPGIFISFGGPKAHGHSGQALSQRTRQGYCTRPPDALPVFARDPSLRLKNGSVQDDAVGMVTILTRSRKGYGSPMSAAFCDQLHCGFAYPGVSVRAGTVEALAPGERGHVAVFVDGLVGDEAQALAQ